MDIGSFLAAVVLGLVAGAIGRTVVRNDAFEKLEGWRSWLLSVVLGLAGAVVGYFIFASLLGIGDDGDAFNWGGVIGAIIGAIIVVFVASWGFRRATGRQHLA